MLYAKVVLGLAVKGPFDYIAGGEIAGLISPGSRVWVDFAGRRQIGYCVGLSQKSGINKLKPVLELIDGAPLLDKNMLLLTCALADYYCCSWGQTIDTALPDSLRKGKRLKEFSACVAKPRSLNTEKPLLIHDLDNDARWQIYLAKIQEALNSGRSALVLAPDVSCALKAKEVIDSALKLDSCLLYRKQPYELEAWLNASSPQAKVVVGTRSAVFAPLKDLGLIIIDEEEDGVYKQDQVPHYHARQAAFMRADLERAKLILGSTSPSLEAFYLARKNKIEYKFIPRSSAFPKIKVIDTRRLSFADRKSKPVLSKFLEEAIYGQINAKGKVLLFLNRRGFATFSFCHNCAAVLKCPRCNISLVYHFQSETLSCHHCNFKMALPKICPQCNAGYIKFAGLGTEKIESELSRLFSGAKIERLESGKIPQLKDADIFVATSAVFRCADLKFGLIGVLSVDNSLNRADFRAAEKTFAVLSGLLRLTDQVIIIQTHLSGHHCFKALEKGNIDLFYEEELKQRKQLGFPPYKYLVVVKLRGKIAARVEEAARGLFKRLKESEKARGVKVVSVNPAQFAQLRGNFCWQVLLSFRDPLSANNFLKIPLKDFRHSGIIVTVDVDPV